MEGEGDKRGGVVVRSRDLDGGNNTGGVWFLRRCIGASSDSVIVDRSMCACETARGATSVLFRPGVSIFGIEFDDHARCREAEGGASRVGLRGSAGFGVVANTGYGRPVTPSPTPGVRDMSSSVP